MRQSSSTTTSARTGIDDSKQYVLMSSDLEELVELDPKPSRSNVGWRAIVMMGVRSMSLSICSVEVDQDDHYVVCLQGEGIMDDFTRLMLENVKFQTTIVDISFNSKVVKLESGKAYLRLSR